MRGKKNFKKPTYMTIYVQFSLNSAIPTKTTLKILKYILISLNCVENLC